MSRRMGREIALQALFSFDFNKEAEKENALEMICAEKEKVSESSKKYAGFLVRGIEEKLTEIDKYLSLVSKDWQIDRMPGVDRNIARMAIYEIKFSPEPLDAGVAINEAVELAKIFGTENSSRFLNGILGSIVKKENAKNASSPAKDR